MAARWQLEADARRGWRRQGRYVDARWQPVRGGVGGDTQPVNEADTRAERSATRKHEDVLARLLTHRRHQAMQRRRTGDRWVVRHAARHRCRVQEVELEITEAPYVHGGAYDSAHIANGARVAHVKCVDPHAWSGEAALDRAARRIPQDPLWMLRDET